MRINVEICHPIPNQPIAGVPPLERMSRVLSAAFESAQIDWCRPQEPVSGEDRLWVFSLFPLWSAQDIASLTFHAQKDVLTWFHPSDQATTAGVLYIPAHVPVSLGLDLSRANFPEESVCSVEMSGSPWTVLDAPEKWGAISRAIFNRNAAIAQNHGVFLADPGQVWIEDDVHISTGVWIGPSVYIGKGTQIAEGAQIHMGCWIRDAVIGPGVELKPYTILDQSSVAKDAQVGPFAHIRPNSVLGPQTKIGNFVETKKVTMGRGSKASHLAYLGDAEIGEDCNIGAGTITCNYDGVNKWKTVLGNDVFIGSDSQLVAPVSVANGAFVAAGSTITNDVPANSLAIARAKQANKEGRAQVLRDRALAMKQKRNQTEPDS